MMGNTLVEYTEYMQHVMPYQTQNDYRLNLDQIIRSENLDHIWNHRECFKHHCSIIFERADYFKETTKNYTYTNF